jgi:hypothetical protein
LRRRRERTRREIHRKNDCLRNSTKVNQKARKNLRLWNFFPRRDLSDGEIARAGPVKNVDCPRAVPHRQSQLMHMVMHSGVFPGKRRAR